MSWRRFLVLVNNLSPHGAVSVQIRLQEEKRKKEPAVDDEAAANAFFSSLMGI